LDRLSFTIGLDKWLYLVHQPQACKLWPNFAYI
jgi:hypothetical protein